MLKEHLERFESVLAKWLLAVAGLGVGVFTVAVVYSTFMRFVVQKPQGWAEEFPSYLMIWSGLLAAAACVARDSHLVAGVVSMLTHRPVVQRSAGILARLMILFFVVVVGKAGWNLSMLMMSNLTSALQIPFGLVYLSVPVSFAAMALVLVSRLIRSLF